MALQLRKKCADGWLRLAGSGETAQSSGKAGRNMPIRSNFPMPENDRSAERPGHENPHRDFEEDPLVELARIVSEGSNTRLSAEGRTAEPFEQGDFDEAPGTEYADHSGYQTAPQDDDVDQPEFPDEYQDEAAAFPPQLDDAFEAELDAAFESRFPVAKSRVTPLSPDNSYPRFNAFGSSQPRSDYGAKGERAEATDAGYRHEHDERQDPYTAEEDAAGQAASVEPPSIERQTDEAPLDEDPVAGFEDELRTAFDLRVGAQQRKTEAAPGRDEFDDLFDEVTSAAPSMPAGVPPMKTESGFKPESRGNIWPRAGSSVRAPGEQTRQPEVKSPMAEARQPVNLATFGMPAPIPPQGDDLRHGAADYGSRMFASLQEEAPEEEYHAAPQHDAEEIAEESDQRPGSGYDDDYDDLYEENPPAEGYDLDAVARAMKESDPALSGHGVLPPHSAAEEMAAPEGRSRRGLMVAVVIAGLAILGGAAFALVDFGVGDADLGPPPVIVAEEGDLKVYPEESQEQSGQSKLIYDRVGVGGSQPTQEEKLIVPEETPVASLPPVPVSEPEVSRSAASPLPAGPRRVRTVIVRPDGTIISSGEDETEAASPPVASQPETAAAPIAPLPADTARPNAATLPATTQTSPLPANQPEVETAAVTTEEEAQQAPVIDNPPSEAEAQAEVPAVASDTVIVGVLPRAKPATRPTEVASAPAEPQQNAVANDSAPLDLTGNAAAPVATAEQTPPQTAATATVGSIPAGTFVVQVSSQRSEEQAQTAFADLKRRYGSVLGSVTPVIEKAELGERGTFYRVRIPSASRDQAIRLCEDLKAAGGDCFVRQN